MYNLVTSPAYSSLPINIMYDVPEERETKEEIQVTCKEPQSTPQSDLGVGIALILMISIGIVVARISR